MEEAIQPGLQCSQDFLVEEQHGAAHVGSGTLSVLATPWMIAFMEITARQLLDEHLPESHTSVGTRVDVRHLAACPIGAYVMATVQLAKRDGQRLSFEVRLDWGEKQIGSGQHERYIIEKDRFLQGLIET